MTERIKLRMWIRYVILGLWGFCAGAGSACGFFAVLSVICLLPIMAYKTQTAFFMKKYQWFLVAGVVFGSVVFLYEPRVNIPDACMVVFGLAMGCFAGGFLAALAETLNAFPVVFRRLKVKMGFGYLLLSFAVSKTLGNLFFFFFYEK